MCYFCSMKYDKQYVKELDTNIEISFFQTDGGVSEWHVMIHVTPHGDGFAEQYKRIEDTERILMEIPCMKVARPVFKRYFLSDSANQQPLMTPCAACTVSYIQQPPMDGSKVALWIYLQSGTEIVPNADRLGSTVAKHNGYEHIWTMGMTDSNGGSYEQTETLLERYEDTLASAYNANIADHCVRTWFFVRDVDTQYHGLVVARRENFAKNGLTENTHFISSTGIGGNPSDTKALVQLGCYALKGSEPSQQSYLYAPTHLNRTYDYGVTFERGTLVRYGDRSHAFISGTASIDNKGDVVHVGDIRRQTMRMWENVEKLLEEAGMTMDDAAQVTVYLRDTADYDVVRRMFSEKYPGVPTVITLAPVCRPAWLIEMECMAVKETHNEGYKDF